jgi:hypothetical protein
MKQELKKVIISWIMSIQLKRNNLEGKMKSRKIALIVGVTIVTILAFTACDVPTPTATVIPESTPLPDLTCPPDQLQQPILSGPADHTVVDSLSPILSWEYPRTPYPSPDSVTVCVPESFNIDLSKGPFYLENIGGSVTGSTNSYLPFSTLESGQTYHWGVGGATAGTNGPFAGYNTFFTGTTCDSASFAAPELMNPADHATVRSLTPMLVWDNPSDCVPPGYRVDLSIDPGFGGPNLGGGTGSADTRWGTGAELEDCTQYYWKISAVSADGTVIGPASPTFNFRTDTGTCAVDPAVLQNGITGFVWEDLCRLPESGPLPSPLPAGCVATATWAQSNGTREPGEPGIENVMVRIGSGSCPSTGLGVTFTDSSGFYYFEDLPAGTYCLSVDSLENAGALIPGDWVSPAVTGSQATIEMSMPDVEAYMYETNFGWAYQFGPSVQYAMLDGVVYGDHCAHTLSTDPAMVTEGCSMGADGIIAANGIPEADETGIENVNIDVYRGTCESYSFDWIGSDRTGIKGEFQFFLPLYAPESAYCLRVIGDSRVNRMSLGAGVWSNPRTLETDAAIDVTVIDTSSQTIFLGWDQTISPIGILDRPTYEFIADEYCYFGPSMQYKAMVLITLGSFYAIEGVDPTRQWVQIAPNSPLSPYVSCYVDPNPPYTQIDDEVTWGRIGVGKTDWSAIFKIDDEVTWGRIGIIDPDPPTLQHIIRNGLFGVIGVVDPDPPSRPGCGIINPDPPTSQLSLHCWVPILKGNVVGDLDGLPRISGPALIFPTPTFTPTAPPPQQPSCGDFTDQTTCNNHANDMLCYWNTYLKPAQCVHQ